MHTIVLSLLTTTIIYYRKSPRAAPQLTQLLEKGKVIDVPPAAPGSNIRFVEP